MVLHWLESIYQVCNQRGRTSQQEATSATRLEMVSTNRLLIFEKASNSLVSLVSFMASRSVTDLLLQTPFYY